MYQFIESIRVENGVVFGLRFHQKRVNETYQQFFPKAKAFSLRDIIRFEELPKHGLYKLRIVYDVKVREMELQAYLIPRFHTYQTFEVASDFDYTFKSLDRHTFDEISSGLEKDILPILIKGSLVSDSTFSNLIFEKEGLLYTPATPLLYGTMLQQTMKERAVEQVDIRIDDIELFEKIYPINAMNPFGQIEGINI